MIVIFHPEAYDEMFESARFFEEKDAGLGFDLIDAIQESVNRILKFPQSPYSTKPIEITSSLPPSSPASKAGLLDTAIEITVATKSIEDFTFSRTRNLTQLLTYYVTSFSLRYNAHDVLLP